MGVSGCLWVFGRHLGGGLGDAPRPSKGNEMTTDQRFRLDSIHVRLGDHLEKARHQHNRALADTLSELAAELTKLAKEVDG